MVFAEELAGLSGIAVQAFAGGVRDVIVHSEVVHWLVGLLAGAFASPPLSGMMMVPERVIHRKGEPAAPEFHMYRVRFCRSGRHPSQIRIDILFGLKVLPVRCSMGTDDCRVVFGVQPLVTVLAGERSHIPAELLV